MYLEGRGWCAWMWESGLFPACIQAGQARTCKNWQFIERGVSVPGCKPTEGRRRISRRFRHAPATDRQHAVRGQRQVLIHVLQPGVGDEAVPVLAAGAHGIRVYG